jgi:hypothetical protein
MKQDVEDTFSAAIRERAESKSTLGKSDAERQEMQKRMEAACTPGPAHKALDWVLNGRFLEEEFHGEMMGKAFTGRSLMGYDNIKGTFSIYPEVRGVRQCKRPSGTACDFVTPGPGNLSNILIAAAEHQGDRQFLRVRLL